MLWGRVQEDLPREGAGAASALSWMSWGAPRAGWAKFLWVCQICFLSWSLPAEPLLLGWHSGPQCHSPEHLKHLKHLKSQALKNNLPYKQQKPAPPKCVPRVEAFEREWCFPLLHRRCWSFVQDEMKEAWKMSKGSQEGKRCEETGWLQATITEPQSQPQHRQHRTAPGTLDQAAPAPGGTVLLLSSGRKAPFPAFSACQQPCIILRLTKCESAGRARGERGAGLGSARERGGL